MNVPVLLFEMEGVWGRGKYQVNGRVGKETEHLAGVGKVCCAEFRLIERRKFGQERSCARVIAEGECGLVRHCHAVTSQEVELPLPHLFGLIQSGERRSLSDCERRSNQN